MRLLGALALFTALLLFTPAFAGTAYDDVPTNHWAYNSLDYLTQEGVLDGYPEGFFKGERTLTRYEFAQAVSRLLDTVQQNGADESVRVMAESLRAEFSDQLAELRRQVDKLGSSVNDLDSRIGDLEGQVAGNAHKLGDLSDKINHLKPGPEWKGAFRYRWQIENWGDHERFRHRIAFTLGYNKQVSDDVAVAFRLRTRSGEDPTSSHATLGRDGRTSTIFLDQAYAKYTPDWLGKYTTSDCKELPRLDVYAGLMPNISYDAHEMVLAVPVNLQGMGLVYHFNEDFQVLAAESVAVEVDGDDYFDDSTLYITELKHTNLFTKGLDAWLGCYGWSNENSLPAGVFNCNALPGFDFNNDGIVDGNDRFSTAFRTVKGGMQYTFPCVFEKPLAVFAEYIQNLDSDAEDRIEAVNPFIDPDIIYDGTDDAGFGAGAQLGKAPVKQGEWYAFVHYKEIGANAVVSGLSDSEAGNANTNSFKVHASYMWADGSMLGITYFLNKMHNAYGFLISDAKQDRTNMAVDWTFSF